MWVGPQLLMLDTLMSCIKFAYPASFDFSIRLPVFACLSSVCYTMSAKSAFLVGVCCVLNLSAARCESVGGDSPNDWVPGSLFANSSSIAWFPRKEDANFKTKVSARSFSDNQLDNVDRAFDYNEFNEREELKAVPFLPNAQTIASSTGQAPLNFQTNVKGPGSSASLPASSYFPQHQGLSYPSAQAQTPSQSYGPPSQGYQSGYYYTAPQYLPPAPSLNIETFENFSPNTFTNQTVELELNTKNLLFVQAGKCSNSIEVGRVRDVEVKTAVKYGAEAQKGICVLMLYAANELNKLAISLQGVQGTTNIVPMGSWLETNVKMYAVQAGEIMPISLNANYGPGSPALVLTKSNIVLLSFVIDRPVDFFVDISTYQSPTC